MEISQIMGIHEVYGIIGIVGDISYAVSDYVFWPFFTPDPYRESPTCYVQEKPNCATVAEILENRGWQRRHRYSLICDLIWMELSSGIDYAGHIEGQLVNHIPNHSVITNKDTFVITLRAHEETTGRRFQWHPATYLSNKQADVDAALAEAEAQPGTIWILKPCCGFGGCGIEMARGLAELRQKISASQRMVIQSYIERPLLLTGRKCDIRVYLLVARTAPYHLWFFHPGYCRVAMAHYDCASLDNRKAHITNFTKNVWTEEDVEAHLIETNRSTAPCGQLWQGIHQEMKSVLAHIFEASKDVLARRSGYFELFGVDFLLDEDMHVYLLELNSDPLLRLHIPNQDNFATELLGSSLDIVLAAQRPDHDDSAPVVLSPFELVVDEANGFAFQSG